MLWEIVVYSPWSYQPYLGTKMDLRSLAAGQSVHLKIRRFFEIWLHAHPKNGLIFGACSLHPCGALRHANLSALNIRSCPTLPYLKYRETNGICQSVTSHSEIKKDLIPGASESIAICLVTTMTMQRRRPPYSLAGRCTLHACNKKGCGNSTNASQKSIWFVCQPVKYNL